MKRIFLLLLLSATIFGCNQNAANKANTSTGEPPYTKDAKPQADTEIVVIETADFGTIKIELYSNIAPKHVARFKELATEGVYNRTQIHRIDPMLGIIQGGDPLSKDDNPDNDGQGNSGKPNLPGEFSDVPYDTGIVGAARGGSFDSANSQFFIMTKRQPAFDKKYTIFGKVIEGQNVVNLIANAPRKSGKEQPEQPVIIKSVRVEKK